MHADELDITVGLVRALLAAQCPQWSGLPLRRVPSAGTENALFRLGTDLVVRLPRLPGAVDAILAERRWLPRLAPHLPLAVPAPVVDGLPDEEFPWPWSVYRWLDGDTPATGAVDETFARDLADFILALRRIPPDGPPAGRGRPLAYRDDATRAAIAELAGVIDSARVTAVWDDALRLPGAEVAWLHGDLAPGNVLVRDGRLTAVIDFGTAGVGDPTADHIPAWNLLPPGARAAFRAALAVDDVTWSRGRALALSIALIQLPYYKDTNPVLAANARHVIAEVLSSLPSPPRT